MIPKKVIVFGGSGFLGSHVSDSLTQNGYDVTIFDTSISKYLKSNQKMFVGDINNQEQIDNVLLGAEIVYNFAGISDIDVCHKNPIATIESNILGNARILKSSIQNNIKRYLFASSAYVYSASGSYYRISKQSSELFTESFCNNKVTNYTILRYGSLYGSRSDMRNSLFQMIYSAVKKGQINYHGTGEEKRELINVKDAADLSVKALEKDYKNQILMLTGSNSIKYDDLLDMINEMFSYNIKIKKLNSISKTHYKMSPYSFNPKIAKKLVSNPHIDLGQGILNLIEEIHKK